MKCTRRGREANIFSLIPSLPSNYWENIVDTDDDYAHGHTRFHFPLYYEVENSQNISICGSHVLSQAGQGSKALSGERRGKVCDARHDSGTVFLDWTIIWQKWHVYWSDTDTNGGVNIIDMWPTDDLMPHTLHNFAVFWYMWQKILFETDPTPQCALRTSQFSGAQLFLLYYSSTQHFTVAPIGFVWICAS